MRAVPRNATVLGCLIFWFSPQPAGAGFAGGRNLANQVGPQMIICYKVYYKEDPHKKEMRDDEGLIFVDSSGVSIPKYSLDF